MQLGPNILITGTPGVGKSTLAQLVAEHSNLEHIHVGELAIKFNCLDGYDEELSCPIINEDKVLDELEEPIQEGGKIVEYHGCDFFPERFFDIVFVLRTNNTVLYDRLVAKGYTSKKLENNMECEIMGVILEEARESYKADIIHELQSNTIEDLENNLQMIVQWIEVWKQNNSSG